MAVILVSQEILTTTANKTKPKSTVLLSLHTEERMCCTAEQGITIGYCMNIVSYEEGVSTCLRPPIALIYLLFYNKPLPQPLIYAFNVSAHSFFLAHRAESKMSFLIAC